MVWLSHYALFLAKFLTFFVGIGFFLSFFALLCHRTKDKARLQIVDLNQKIAERCEHLQTQTLPKKAYQKWRKTQSTVSYPCPRLFVIRFQGDIRASGTQALKEMVSLLITIAAPLDEVLVIIESNGGLVPHYGLAASQLERLRQHSLIVTVAIDKVAASGGYLMACVATHIIAAPFAMVGSIGVVAQFPNLHRFLDKHMIDFELHTAGQYKRTLTLFGKNTEEGRQKFQETLEDTHTLFKQFIAHYRPQVPLEIVATGEWWHAKQALAYHLVDAIQTSDEFVLSKIHSHRVFELSLPQKRKWAQKWAMMVAQAFEKYPLARAF